MSATKTPKLAIAMNYIRDDLISGAIDYKPAPQKKVTHFWKHMGAVAASFAVLLCVVAIFHSELIHSPHNNEAAWSSEINYNDAVYTVIPTDDSHWLLSNNLPTIITDEMVGDIEGYATVNTKDGEKKIPVYSYDIVDADAVKIVQQDGQFKFIIYTTNDRAVTNNLTVIAKDMLYIWGIQGSNDIVSISEIDPYTGTAKHTSYDNDISQKLYKELSVLTGTGVPNDIRGEFITLAVECNSGLTVELCYYPETQILYHAGISYSVSETLYQLIENSILSSTLE